MMRSMQYVFIEASWYEALDLDVLTFNVHVQMLI
jgi:hypothetical protein